MGPGSLGEAQPDAVAVRKAARALLRAAGYDPHAVMWFSCYSNQLRIHVVTAAGVVKYVHRLDGGEQSWGER